MPRPNMDVFGYCIMCGLKCIEERVVDGVSRVVFTKDKDELQFILNDKSRMRVLVCKKCKNEYSEKDNEYIMKAVQRGWQHEIETYSHWTDDRKKEYMKKYGALEIVCRDDTKVNEILRRHQKITNQFLHFLNKQKGRKGWD